MGNLRISPHRWTGENDPADSMAVLRVYSELFSGPNREIFRDLGGIVNLQNGHKPALSRVQRDSGPFQHKPIRELTGNPLGYEPLKTLARLCFSMTYLAVDVPCFAVLNRVLFAQFIPRVVRNFRRSGPSAFRRVNRLTNAPPHRHPSASCRGRFARNSNRYT